MIGLSLGVFVECGADVYKRQTEDVVHGSPPTRLLRSTLPRSTVSVSYTHLDVYKRQVVSQSTSKEIQR